MVAIPRAGPHPRHAWEVPLVGVPTRFESNAQDVIAITRDALGAWRDATPPSPPTERPVIVQIDVDDGGPTSPAGPVPLRYHTERGRLTITGPGVDAVAEVTSRRAFARVSRALVGDAEHFRYGIAEALALFIVSALDRQPLHAAGIARDHAVLLLLGSAGVGKSTLTYAASRAGYRVFAEDIVWLQQRPALRVWGLSPRIHLPADAGRHFPELVGRPSALVAAGEPKIVVPIEPHQRAAVPFATGVGVCLLDRPRRDRPSVRPVDPRVVRRALTPTEPGFRAFADTIGPALDALAAPGGWRLRASSTPTAAVPLLGELLGAVAARSA